MRRWLQRLFALLWGSAPLLRGTLRVAELPRGVRIERDRQGLPTITAADRVDASFGLGFLHAQERFFQMDLCRRGGAGRLAELLGDKAIEMDRQLRLHRFESVATSLLEGMSDADRRLLEAFAAGVNAGMRAQRARPFEYWLLFARPEPSCARDTLLVVFCFYLLVQDGDAGQDYHLHNLFDALPPALARFLSPTGVTGWDAPLDGEGLPQAPVPDVLMSLPQPLPFAASESGAGGRENARRAQGSNACAVAAARSANGRALLANDIHLRYGVPTTFYRASLRYRDAGELRAVDGITVPGFPCILAGTNRQVAWGITNSAADWVDLVKLDQEGLPRDHYRTESGVEAVREVAETIRSRGGKSEPLVVEETRFGPIVRTSSSGVRFAQQWVAHDRRAVNLGLLRLEGAADVDAALDAAQGTGMPAQNITVIDRAGRIGWTIVGSIPRRRAGNDGRLPLWSSDPRAGWSGWLDAPEYPKVSDPPGGCLWTANARVVSGESLAKLGHGYYIVGARASMLRDAMATQRDITEADLRRLQTDDRAIFLKRWRGLFLDAAAGAAGQDEFATAHSLVHEWSGRAERDSVAYRLVRGFRAKVEEVAFAPFIAKVMERHPDFRFTEIGDHREEPLWQLVTRRPLHLLPRDFASWEGLLEHCAMAVVLEATADGRRLADFTWGRENRLRMRHLFSGALPLVGWLNDMPEVGLNGDLTTPLGQYVEHGPVLRLVVSPGDEDNATMTMPCGQTAHASAP